MDHLGIQEFMVMGFWIGDPFIWNMLRRASERVAAAALAQPSGFRPELPERIPQAVRHMRSLLAAHRPATGFH
jgi:hypothetical protein